jgi:hypothetical protein
VPPPGGTTGGVELVAGDYPVVCRYDDGQIGEARLTVASE